jgi:hypothetical protein
MNINFNILGKYFKKNGYPANANIDIEEPGLIIFKPGEDDNSNLSVPLEFDDINLIMRINGVYDKITETKNSFETRFENRERVDLEIDDLIYDTLSKYIIEMLNAAVAIRIFPEIIPIPKHKPIYFKY